MNTILYFAYGSNLNLAQMDIRCPGAKPYLEPAFAPGYTLAFAGSSGLWGGGVATIIPARGGLVAGGLWMISDEHEEELDYYEGVPDYYHKATIKIRHRNKSSTRALTYIKDIYSKANPDADSAALPSKKYIDGIRAGYKSFGLSATHLFNAISTTAEMVMVDNPEFTSGDLAKYAIDLLGVKVPAMGKILSFLKSGNLSKLI